MNLFVDYVQPLTSWLQENPNWSLFITFIIALSESLAIIGSIIPGSVTMTAIGILAGSGYMRIDLTLIAAALGAVVGDSLSYMLGYYYSDRLNDIWPFSKYPTWLSYGKDFFHSHGGKSVLFGRFVGPLRSIIPVIAGILHMKQWRFFLANVISGILWSLLYVMPGVLIGAASHELSAESSTRLLVFILLSMAGIWLLSMLIKWLFIKLNSFLRSNLHARWESMRNNRLLDKIFLLITPKSEKDHFTTASLIILTIFSLLGLITFLIISAKTQWRPTLNVPIHLLVQSFRTSYLDNFFIVCTQLTSSITIAFIYLCFCLWFIYTKHTRALVYATSIIIFSSLIASGLVYLLATPRPQGVLVQATSSSLPLIYLTIATAFYGFLLFFIHNKYALTSSFLKSNVYVVLGLSGLGSIFLGDYWFSEVFTAYFAGVSVCLIHCLIYRKSDSEHVKKRPTALLISGLILLLICATTLSSYINFKSLKRNHTTYQRQYTLSEKNWWEQSTPTLPLYVLNRIGQRISLLNIQYSGDLDLLEQSLAKKGWKLHDEAFFGKILQRMSNKSNEVKLPLLDVLFENKHPELIMTLTNPNSTLTFELRIWQSNYFLIEVDRPIWIGSVHLNKATYRRFVKKQSDNTNFINPLTYVLPALDPFKVRRLIIPKKLIKPTSIPSAPYILLIKE